MRGILAASINALSREGAVRADQTFNAGGGVRRLARAQARDPGREAEQAALGF